MKNEVVVVEWSYDAGVEKVWRAVTELEEMRKWYFEMLEEFKAEVGFKMQFNVHNEGKDYLHIWKVTEVELMKKIAYQWRYGGYPGNSLVTFELRAEGDKTKIKLTHEGLETFMPEVNPGLSKENFEIGWRNFIGKLLKEFVEE